MSDELRRSIDRIRELSPKLNIATDEANRVVLAVEKFLNEECKVGLPASVPVASRPSRDAGALRDEATKTLEYRRVDGKFRIAVGEREDSLAGHPDDRFIHTAWQDCPRSDKLETFPHLPALLDVLAQKVGSCIEKTQETCSTAQQLMDILVLEAMTPEALDATLRDAMESAVLPVRGSPGGTKTRTVRAFVKGPGDSFLLNPEVERHLRETQGKEAGDYVPPPPPTTSRQEFYRERAKRGR